MNMRSNEFPAVLQSARPAPEIEGSLDIFGRLIGSWSAEVIDFDVDGTRHVSRGEWHFSRVLEGRAIQDVWVVPSRRERDEGTPNQRNRYGITMRVYDPKQKVWRVTWINPVRGVETRLVGRQVGNDIVQEGVDAAALIRWSFRNIQSDSFLWVGERSTDGGKTWARDAEFRARRMGAEQTRSHRVRERNVLWASVTSDGFEHLQLSFESSGLAAEGIIVRRAPDGLYRVRYWIDCDERSRVRAVTLARLDASEARLVLRSDGDGNWTDDAGRRMQALDGCIDVDIKASPFTNTLAIRRLALKPLASQAIRVVFIDPADLSVHAVSQRYTLIGIGDTQATYRYESLESGFTSNLPVDKDSLLLEYPEYFRRVW